LSTETDFAAVYIQTYTPVATTTRKQPGVAQLVKWLGYGLDSQKWISSIQVYYSSSPRPDSL